MAKVFCIIKFDSEKKSLYDGLNEGGGLTRTLMDCGKEDFKFGIAKLYQMEKFEWVLEIDGKIHGIFKTSKDARVALGAKMSLKALTATRGMYQKNAGVKK